MGKDLKCDVGDLIILDDEIGVVIKVGNSEVFNVPFTEVKFPDGRTRHLTMTRLTISRAKYLEATNGIR